MLNKETKALGTIWKAAQMAHKNQFSLTGKDGNTYIVKNRNGMFNIYTKYNTLIADQISNTEDLANCLTMISNRK